MKSLIWGEGHTPSTATGAGGRTAMYGSWVSTQWAELSLLVWEQGKGSMLSLKLKVYNLTKYSLKNKKQDEHAIIISSGRKKNENYKSK